MKSTKRARLEAKGWRVGSADEFLELNPEEAALVETRLALSRTLRERRVAQKLTQGDLARRLHSSQSRVAKMEAGDKAVSVDLLLKGLFALGARPGDVGRALRRRTTAWRAASAHGARSQRAPRTTARNSSSEPRSRT